MFTILLLAVVFALLLQWPGQTASASAFNEPPVIALQADQATAEHNRYAGTDGASPFDEVPVFPIVGATTALLLVLSVVAVRRGWLL